jgi:allophanate hydrolase
MLPEMLDLASLRALYAGGTSPLDVADALAARMAASSDPAIFITAVDRDGLRRQAEELLARAPEPNSLPLWGVPFAVKDNIDVAGLPTTAACPAFAYTPERDAFAVARLRAAGALVVGKTNLDQFATGLNGTRSPYGAPRCVFDPAYISGGSSSGSGVAVAAGLAAFALGTDTAGSGRVPAALNNIVGVKPTPGRISATGMVPACRSLDTISIFAGSVADAVEIRAIAEGFDPADAFSRVGAPVALPSHPRIGVLRAGEREFYGDGDAERLYAAAVARLTGLGAQVVAFDYAPFREIAVLLYDGPWVAERLAALEAFAAGHAADLDPAVRAIVEGARRFSAVDAFNGRYKLKALRRRTEATWAACDALLLPTAPTTYTVEAMRADPIRLNSRLGHYTNFANLLGLAAIAAPAGFTSAGLAFGVTLVGPGSSDDALAPLADALHRAAGCGTGRARAPLRSAPATPPDDRIELAVVGAHLSGLPLNGELVALGGRFLREVTTAPDYRLYALTGTTPPKPGLVRDPGFAGPGVPAEVWSLTPAAFGRFVAAIPQPLGIGRIAMTDGSMPSGFLCERWAIENARKVEGGWRAFVAAGA